MLYCGDNWYFAYAVRAASGLLGTLAATSKMQSINNTPVFIFTPKTLVDIRKIYNLDGPGRMEEAIDLLEDWIKKQNHLVKKDFSRDYLERCIICCKGSVEKAKKNIDSLCTLRTMMPQMYGDYDFRNDVNFKNMFKIVKTVILSRFAADCHRVFILRCTVQQANKQAFGDYYRFSFSLCDYWRAHDYCMGFIAILDYRHMSITEFIASVDLIEVRTAFNMYIEGFNARIKGIHILTSSPMIHMVVKLLKQVASPKIRDRFHVHDSLEALYEAVPRDILPVEYGGKEKSLDELQDDWIDVLVSKDHKEFMKDMNKAVVNENCRLKNNYADEMGQSGTFRSLNVD